MIRLNLLKTKVMNVLNVGLPASTQTIAYTIHKPEWQVEYAAASLLADGLVVRAGKKKLWRLCERAPVRRHV